MSFSGTPLKTGDQSRSGQLEGQRADISDAFASRDWYKQFDKDHITPAITKLTKAIVKGKEVWKPIDDSAVRQEFIQLAKQILKHYQARKLATKNLANYIEAIEIADRELTPYRKTTMGYLHLLPIAKLFSDAKAKKEEVKLPGALGHAFATFKRGNLPDKKGKIPLLTITSDAERDFALLAQRFMIYFALNKDPKIIIKYDQRSLNNAMSTDMVLDLFKTHQAKFAKRVHDYEADILLATLTSADVSKPVTKPSGSNGTAAHTAPVTSVPQKTVTASAAGAQASVIDAPKPVEKPSSTNETTADTPSTTRIPQKTMTVPTENAQTSSVNVPIQTVMPSISDATTHTTAVISTSQNTMTTPATEGTPTSSTDAPKQTVTPATASVVAPASISQPAETQNSIQQQTVHAPVASSNGIVTPNLLSPVHIPEHAASPKTKPDSAPVVTVLAASPQRTSPTSIAQPEIRESPVTIAAPLIVPAPAQQSFFQRHKKKILWGLGIGLCIGLSIATAGIFAIALSGTIAVAAVVGATTVLKAVGIGVGLTAATSVLGAVSTATGCAVHDCCKSVPEEPATPPMEHAYIVIPDNWDTGRIHRETGMPIVKPGIPAPTFSSVAANTQTAPQNTVTNAVADTSRHDDTRIEQYATRGM